MNTDERESLADSSTRLADALERIAACFESMAHDLTSSSVQSNVMADQIMGLFRQVMGSSE
jgi:hypothetical protein